MVLDKPDNKMRIKLTDKEFSILHTPDGDFMYLDNYNPYEMKKQILEDYEEMTWLRSREYVAILKKDEKALKDKAEKCTNEAHEKLIDAYIKVLDKDAKKITNLESQVKELKDKAEKWDKVVTEKCNCGNYTPSGQLLCDECEAKQ